MNGFKVEKLVIDYFLRDASGYFSPHGLRHVKSLPYLSVVQSIEGSYRVSVGNGPTCRTGDGGFFIAPAGQVQDIVHDENPATHRMYNRWVFLTVTVNDKYRLDDLYDFPVIAPPPTRERLGQAFDSLFAADDCIGQTVACYHIVAALLESAALKTGSQCARLLPVLDYIYTHYAEPLDVEQLAAVAFLSPSRLYAAFKTQFGTSPMATVNRYRLTVASTLLKDDSLSIADVAARVGFDDPFYFSRAFKSLFRLSPRAYRKQLQFPV